MVIFSHMRSRTSSPDSGDAIALATDAMSECSERLKSSKPAAGGGGGGHGTNIIGVIYTGDAEDMSPPLFKMDDFVPIT